MRPGIHFNQEEVKCPTANKTLFRLIFAIAAAHVWQLEITHMAGIWENCGKSVGRGRESGLGKITYGPCSRISNTNEKYEEIDPCLFLLHTYDDQIRVAVMVDYFVVTAKTPALVD